MKQTQAATSPFQFAVIGSGPKHPIIEKDPAWCLMVLSGSLRALSDLTRLSMTTHGGEAQFNELQRADLSDLFSLLGDYAEAARRAIPEDATCMALAGDRTKQ
ncbi:MAG: hypothetical protein ACO1PN_15855 [Betaproteobacteria bacterium]